MENSKRYAFLLFALKTSMEGRFRQPVRFGRNLDRYADSQMLKHSVCAKRDYVQHAINKNRIDVDDVIENGAGRMTTSEVKLVGSPSSSAASCADAALILENVSKQALQQLFEQVGDIHSVRLIENNWRLKMTRTYATTRPNAIYLHGSRHTFFHLDFTVLEEYYHVLKQWNTGSMTRTSWLLENMRKGYAHNRFEVEAKRFAAHNTARFRVLKSQLFKQYGTDSF